MTDVFFKDFEVVAFGKIIDEIIQTPSKDRRALTIEELLIIRDLATYLIQERNEIRDHKETIVDLGKLTADQYITITRIKERIAEIRMMIDDRKDDLFSHGEILRFLNIIADPSKTELE